MKTRHDFVSNSSSSSFIINDNGFFMLFGITKKDIYDALVDLYGGKEHCDSIVNHEIEYFEKQLAEESISKKKNDWYVKYLNSIISELKHGEFSKFCVYDMNDRKDRKKCFEKWDRHFSSWYAPNEGEYEQWEKMVDLFHWKCDFDNIEEVANKEENTLKISSYSKSKRKRINKKFNDGAKFIQYVKEKLKIKTMKEALHSKDCSLMIHFNDNEIYNIKGMSDNGKDDAKLFNDLSKKTKYASSKWDSESYSSDRFFEILIKYFIDNGKIDLSNPKLLENWAVDKNDDFYRKKYPGKKYYLDNDKATWKDVVDDIFHCNSIMHEG